MAGWDSDDDGLWNDDGDNNDDDSESWDVDSEDEKEKKTTTTTAAAAPVTNTTETKEIKKEVKKPVKKAGGKQQFNEWDSESSEDEVIDDGPKRSTKKSKLKRERIKNLDRPKAAPVKKKQKEEDSDSDSSDSSDEGEGIQINRFEMNERENAMAGFGDDGGAIKKKKKKKKEVFIPRKVGDLYKIDNDMSRKDQSKELKRLAYEISEFILDLSMPGIDQNGKKVHPRIKGYQVKDFICTFINKCAAPLDANELAAVRIQAESEIKTLAARERQARKDKRNKKAVKKPKPRRVHIEQYENTYVSGQYDGNDFEAFI